MLKIVASNQFKRDLKAAAKRKLDLERMNEVVDRLAREEALPPSCRDHALSGSYAGFRECHVGPDWLLIYRIEKAELELYLFRTGTHADLF